MKLVVAIVHIHDAAGVVDALLRHEYRATRLNSSGGFLRRTNVTLLIGVEESAVDEVIGIIRASTKARTEVAPRGSAATPSGRLDVKASVVFVTDIEGVVQL